MASTTYRKIAPYLHRKISSFVEPYLVADVMKGNIKEVCQKMLIPSVKIQFSAEPLTCPICIDILSDTILSTRCCNTLYCAKCLLRWLFVNDTCPLCGINIYINHLQFEI